MPLQRSHFFVCAKGHVACLGTPDNADDIAALAASVRLVTLMPGRAGGASAWRCSRCGQVMRQPPGASSNGAATVPARDRPATLSDRPDT